LVKLVCQTFCKLIQGVWKLLVQKNTGNGDGELKSSAKKNLNKSPLVFEIKITKNWVKIVSAIVSCQNLAKKYVFFILLYSPSLSRLVTKV
jgi:hypothetical protein